MLSGTILSSCENATSAIDYARVPNTDEKTQRFGSPRTESLRWNGISEAPGIARPNELQFRFGRRGQMARGDPLADTQQSFEFGVFIVSDGTNQPYRVKLRAPGFVHLSAMERITNGYQLADVSAILGSLDIVFGEIDR